MTSLKSQYHNPHTLVWKLPDSPALDINLFDSGYASAESSKDSASSREEAPPLGHHISGGKLVYSNYGSKPSLSTRKNPPRLAEIPFFAPLCPSITSVRTPGGGMKLPPTIVTRQMPLPIQNLPTLSPSPQTATDHNAERLRRPSLHSVPSLTRIGREAPAEMDDEMEEINEEDEEMDADEFEDAADGSPTSSHSNSNASVLTQSNSDSNNGITLSTEHTPRLADPQEGKAQSQSTPRSSRASTSHHVDGDDYFALTDPETSFLLPIIVTTAASPSASHLHPSSTSAAPQARGFNGSNVDHHHHPPTLSIQAQDLSNANVHTVSLPTPRAIPPSSLSLTVERRPSIYRQASQSMANLLSPTQLHAAAASAIALTSGYGEPPSKRLTRRTSMPSMQPPTYVATMKHSDASFARFRHLRPEPREEEGLEPLPSYELTVPLLSGLLLMKMEFSSPGILSKERNWHRVWCVLQGTSFKVYEGEKGLEKIGGWIGRQKERVAMMEAQTARNKGKGRAEDPIRIRTVAPGETDGDDRPKFTVTSSPTEQSETLSSSNPRSHARTRSRGSMSSMHSQYTSSSRTSINESGPGSMSSSSSNLEVPPPGRMQRRSFSQAIQMIKTNGANMVMRTSATASTTSLSMATPADSMDSDMRRSSSPISPTSSETSMSDLSASFSEISNITSRQLVRHYTLQNAESGVAVDYHKKPNVIRVRLEGEQFLLQVKGVKEVVEWIEGFQSAADVALDLDDRPMPRGPMFPRRRRRRPRTHDPYAEPASAATSEAEP